MSWSQTISGLIAKQRPKKHDYQHEPGGGHCNVMWRCSSPVWGPMTAMPLKMRNSISPGSFSMHCPVGDCRICDLMSMYQGFSVCLWRYWNLLDIWWTLIELCSSIIRIGEVFSKQCFHVIREGMFIVFLLWGLPSYVMIVLSSDSWWLVWRRCCGINMCYSRRRGFYTTSH